MLNGFVFNDVKLVSFSCSGLEALQGITSGVTSDVSTSGQRL